VSSGTSGETAREGASGATLVVMATVMGEVLWHVIGDLRVHPIGKWIRATVGDRTVVDTRRAQLVWEPRRVVGSYAVPEEDIAAELVPSAGPGADEQPVSLEGGPPVLDPRSPFAAHTTAGTALTIRTPDADLPGAAFRPDDPDLAGRVILDWVAFTQWFEEEEPVTAHPRDPFHRIDCLRSSRRVQIGIEGVTLADSTRATMLFETSLPPRFYLPREDVAPELLDPTATHTFCAYKGEASYWSARFGATLLPDIAWSYPDPLNDAVPVRDLISFFTERLDLTLDGEPQPRPHTPWS
jgi:uncharacterized protein (DUF427 family)